MTATTVVRFKIIIIEETQQKIPVFAAKDKKVLY